MSIFIKIGYWEKLQVGLKGWFNVDEHIEKKIEENNAKGISILYGTDLPPEPEGLKEGSIYIRHS